jgi:hypothetical protein
MRNAVCTTASISGVSRDGKLELDAGFDFTAQLETT